jgi:outer membrane protein assembly factor BamD
LKKTLFVAFIIVLFTSCSSKNEIQDYNKPALYWYNKLLDDITTYQLDNADDTFTSLESEHRNSSLIPSALLIIADAHMKDEEYQLAIYYYDSYIKRFGRNDLQDYVRYLKIKAKFMAFKQHFREQKLIDDTISDIDIFVQKHPRSSYINLVKTMQSRLYMSKAILDLEIASLYKRKDKPMAVEYYTLKAQNAWHDINSIKKLDISWYRKILE